MPDMHDETPPLVEVASFETAFDAHLALGLLAAEGLKASIADEHMVSVYSPLTYAVGGVRLLVRAPHAERARAILAARQRGEYQIDELPSASADDQVALAGRAAVRLRVFGRVQGVAFRASMQAVAIELGLDGWTRNRADGSVEALACGERGALDSLVRWVRRGPPQARVDRVEQAWGAAVDATGFEIRPTA